MFKSERPNVRRTNMIMHHTEINPEFRFHTADTLLVRIVVFLGFISKGANRFVSSSFSSLLYVQLQLRNSYSNSESVLLQLVHRVVNQVCLDRLARDQIHLAS